MNDSMKQSFSQRKIRDLIEARFENNLDDTGLGELGEHILNDPAALNEYVEQATLWADLRVLAKKKENQAVFEVNGRKKPVVSLRHIVAFSTAMAASIAGFFFFQKESPEENSINGETATPSFATLLTTSEASWDSENFTMASRLPDRVLRLARGIAAIRMDGGASMVLQGPTEFKIINGSTLDLRKGKVVVRLPEGADIKVFAAGFTLRDLGTEFGILATTGRHAETQFDVFEGEVEVFSTETGLNKLAIKAGQGGRTIEGGNVELLATDMQPYAELSNFAPEICVVSSKLAKEKTDLKRFTGSTEGILLDKGKSSKLGLWVNVQTDMEKKIGKILVPNELVEAASHLYTPNRVKVEWTKAEGSDYPTATAVHNLRPAENEGTITGKVVAKSDDKWIEIKQTDGPLRRYIPSWTGGHPNQGGGLNFVAQKLIRESKLGSKVQVEWIWDERVRLINLLPIN
jgi:hypothetical protein